MPRHQRDRVRRRVERRLGHVQNPTFNRRITPLTTTVSTARSRVRLPEDRLLDRRHPGPRHDQQLRQRPYPPGDLPDLRGELGGLFPPRRQRRHRARRTKAGPRWRATARVRPARGNFSWTTVVPADRGRHHRGEARYHARSGAAGRRHRRLPQRALQFGWVVEIDPYDKTAAPRKRTALGRMNHEGAWPGKFVDGRKPALYMGDDARERISLQVRLEHRLGRRGRECRQPPGDRRQVSRRRHALRRQVQRRRHRQWMPLVFRHRAADGSNAAYAFADQVDILVNARLAADASARPRWTVRNGPRSIRRTAKSTYAHQQLTRTAGQHRRGQSARLYRSQCPAPPISNPNGHISASTRPAIRPKRPPSPGTSIFRRGLGPGPTNINSRA